MKRRKLEENIFSSYRVRVATVFLIVFSSLVLSGVLIVIFELLINLI
jgi:hypothetical protein